MCSKAEIENILKVYRLPTYEAAEGGCACSELRLGLAALLPPPSPLPGLFSTSLTADEMAPDRCRWAALS